MKDWSAYTIQIKQLSSERDAALNDKELTKAIVLQGKINALDGLAGNANGGSDGND